MYEWQKNRTSTETIIDVYSIITNDYKNLSSKSTAGLIHSRWGIVMYFQPFMTDSLTITSNEKIKQQLFISALFLDPLGIEIRLQMQKKDFG